MDMLKIVVFLRSRPRLTLLLLLMALDLALFSAYLRIDAPVLIVTFIDVGQGDAVLVEAPSGNRLLYDAGPATGAVLSGLGDRLPFYDRSIDVAVLSHPDLDHIGGFADVFDRFTVDLVIESGASSTNGAFDAVEGRIAAKGIAKIIARRGMSIDLGGGAFADVLYPDRDTDSMETNAASIVLRLRFGSSSFLLSGDLPIAEESRVVRLEGNGLRSDVLKLGHHGSRTSSSEGWLRASAPKVAVVSAGKENKFGHPHREVLDLLASLGIPVLSTIEEGSIVFRSDGRTIARE